MTAARRRAVRERWPYLAWIVHDTTVAHEEDSRCELIAARTETQARAIWRRLYGYSAADADADTIECTLAVWEWPTEAPPVPQRAQRWWPKGEVDGLEMWRGYGFRGADDGICEKCGDHVPHERMATEFLCSDCAADEPTGDQVQP